MEEEGMEERSREEREKKDDITVMKEWREERSGGKK